MEIALYNFHNLYTATDITRMIISRKIWWVGHVTLLEMMRNVYEIVVGKPEGKRSLRRNKRR
jgi:hypothetical protein